MCTVVFWGEGSVDKGRTVAIGSSKLRHVVSIIPGAA